MLDWIIRTYKALDAFNDWWTFVATPVGVALIVGVAWVCKLARRRGKH
jgi:hypothetical protein